MRVGENNNPRGKTPQLTWRLSAIIFGSWTLYGIFLGTREYINSVYYGRPRPFAQLLMVFLICGYIWALLTPVIIRLSRRFPIERGQYLRSTAFHALASALLSMLQLEIYVLARQWLLEDGSRAFSTRRFAWNFAIYWSILGLSCIYHYYRRYRERERRSAELEMEASQLETQLARAQLDALRMQLHPHFLFNTLNTISVLMQEDVVTANRMLLCLSDLLRRALKNAGTHEVPLQQEMEFLRSYLEIEQTRFQARLKVQIEVDAKALGARVPSMILQPLVENAIRHGVGPSPTESIIEICARRHNGQVELRVRDDGPGIDETKTGTRGGGIGLSNTRERLNKLYGEAHSFHFSSPDGGGTEVTITIPFRPV